MGYYNNQPKIAFAVFAMIGMVAFGFFQMLLNGGLSYDNFKSILFPSLIFGLFMGIAFPFILKKVVSKLEKKIKAPKLLDGENII